MQSSNYAWSAIADQTRLPQLRSRWAGIKNIKSQTVNEPISPNF
jgi:hypothetical protein